MKHADIIILRTYGAEHVTRPPFWTGWYCEHVLAGDFEGLRARIRRYWKGDCLDAIVVRDAVDAEDIALTYEGPHSDEVRYIAACLALGQKPFEGGSGGLGVEIEQPEPVLPSGGVTLDALTL
jgi:hypothetical protein